LLDIEDVYQMKPVEEELWSNKTCYNLL